MRQNNVLLQNLVIITLIPKLVLGNLQNRKMDKCNLPQKIKKEIASYAPIADGLIYNIVNGPYKGTTYKHLAEFIDDFGNRMAASKNLEKGINYMLQKSRKFKLQNVHGEKLEVPHWVRGKESAMLLRPRVQPLSMLGLGSSIGTPSGGIRAKALVVTSFADLKRKHHKARGKIVVFNVPFVNYRTTVIYRFYGASIASHYGAVATLIRSLTPFSLNTPHTGWQMYFKNVTKIPAACITVEDARMLQRMQDRGKQILIELKMEARNLKPAISRNAVAEIVGKRHPKKVVIISGHFDSWDVGQGAMDNGGGSFLSWNSLAVLRALNLRPRRTIRTVLWTAEEVGLVGSLAYFKAHKHEIHNLDFAMEADLGTFTPRGLEYSGLPEVGCILLEILKLLKYINTTEITYPAEGAPDLMVWFTHGVPVASLYNRAERYFWYHHTEGDTLDVEDSSALDKATALWATVSYIIADLSFDMPKNLTKKTESYNLVDLFAPYT